MSKKRVISQIGDSTDGEDYEDDQHNIAILNAQHLNNPYRVSAILKDIGSQILQSTKVREQYVKIKQKFIPATTSREYQDLQKKLGGNGTQKLQDLDTKLKRGWGILVNKYDPKDPTASEVVLSNYYKMNKTIIDRACRQKTQYKNCSDDAEKGRYYLDKVVKIQDNFSTIYRYNKLIEKYAQTQRKDINYVTFDTTQDDASLFLAKIKASKKLDRDLGKNHLYDYKHGTGRLISKTSVTMKTTQQNETLEICKGGAFKHFKTNEGPYETIGQELKKLIEGKFINEKKLREFFQSSLKCKKYSAVIQKNIAATDLIDQLKTDVELIFGIEVKRNNATLLTNAMFFDLVDKGIYKIESIADKMPMAMKGAVSASVIIDKAMGGSTYDYRENPRGTKAAESLLKKDNEILQEWLKLKLNISRKVESLDINNKIRSLGINDLVKKLANMKLDHIDTSKCNLSKQIQDEDIGFNVNDCKGTLRLEWNITSNKYEVKVCQIQEVSAKVFYEFILEWYGIKLPHLNKSDLITLKAAAEPEDPKEDHDYQDDFKVLAIDEGKDGSETAESFEYIQDNSENSVFVQQYYPELIGAVS